MDYLGGGLENMAGKVIESYTSPWKKIMRTIDQKLLRRIKPSSEAQHVVAKSIKRKDQNKDLEYDKENDIDDEYYDEYYYDDYKENV